MSPYWHSYYINRIMKVCNDSPELGKIEDEMIKGADKGTFSVLERITYTDV